jgi:adhesin transport system outer membrane protein
LKRNFLLLLLCPAGLCLAQPVPLQLAMRLSAPPLALTAEHTAAWSLARVLDAALDSHPLMLGRRSAEQAARADKDGAEWARYPTPSVEAFTRNSLGSNGVARLEQPLYTGGRISASIDAAGSRLDAAGSALEEARLDLRLRVVAATVEAVRQQARMERAQDSLDQHRKLLELIQRRVRQEVSSSVDQSLAESRLFQAVNDQSSISQALRNALAQLSQLAGHSVDTVVPDGVLDRNAPLSRERAKESAHGYSPTLQRLDYEEAAATSDIEVRRAALYPNVAVRLERALGSVSESRAMLVLQAQPGAGLSAMSGVQAAQARRDAARQTREAALRDLDERVSTDWNELSAARLRLITTQSAQSTAGEVVASYTRQYVIGRKSWLDVLNAVREATQADYAVEDARAQVAGASLRLRALTGNLRKP